MRIGFDLVVDQQLVDNFFITTCYHRCPSYVSLGTDLRHTRIVPFTISDFHVAFAFH